MGCVYYTKLSPSTGQIQAVSYVALDDDSVVGYSMVEIPNETLIPYTTGGVDWSKYVLRFGEGGVVEIRERDDTSVAGLHDDLLREIGLTDGVADLSITFDGNGVMALGGGGLAETSLVMVCLTELQNPHQLLWDETYTVKDFSNNRLVQHKISGFPNRDFSVYAVLPTTDTKMGWLIDVGL